jgi:hypothetical protein
VGSHFRNQKRLSAKITQLLQAQINAVDELDFAMTKAPDCANTLRDESTSITARTNSPTRQPLPLVVDVESGLPLTDRHD